MAATPPWDKKRPAKTKPTKLTPAKKKAAATHAKKGGRTYPNLVDNMWAARDSKRATKKKPAAAKKKPTEKKSAAAKKKPTKKKPAAAKKRRASR